MINAHNHDSEEKAGNLCKMTKTKKTRPIEPSEDASLIPDQEALFTDYPVFPRNVPNRC